MCVQARSGFFLASRRAPVAASAASSAQREASGGRGSHAAFATSPVGVSRNGPRDTRYRRGRQPRHALRDPTPSATDAWWRRSTRARGKTRPLSKEMGKILEQKRWPTRKLAAYLLERLRIVWWSRRAPRRSRSRMLRSKLVRPLGVGERRPTGATRIDLPSVHLSRAENDVRDARVIGTRAHEAHQPGPRMDARSGAPASERRAYPNA